MPRRSTPVWLGATVAALLVAVATAPAASAKPRLASKPTVVLVHGAWDNPSSWSAVATRLRDRGYAVLVPDNPLRSLHRDSAAIASVLRQVAGPIVLVGHSYGGAVITNAATANSNVRALVYVAAFAPDAGETVLGLVARRPGSILPAALVPTPFIAPDGTVGIDTRINPLLFHSVFAQDLPRERAAAMARGQHPAALPAGTDRSGRPAWRQVPSWFLVARSDRVIPPAVERLMAARAGSHTTEVTASHAAHVSQPEATTNLILAAASSTRAAGVERVRQRLPKWR